MIPAELMKPPTQVEIAELLDATIATEFRDIVRRLAFAYNTQGTQIVALLGVYHWAQAVLTAWNIGVLPQECPLHKKLREVLINYRETL